jgi:hypothetical protein
MPQRQITFPGGGFAREAAMSLGQLLLTHSQRVVHGACREQRQPNLLLATPCQLYREPRCGLLVIDLNRGDTIAWVRIEGVVRELYDVAFIPGIRNPSAIGFKAHEIFRVISIDES